MEDLLYEVESVRRFVVLKLTGALPDETTILKFRHRLEEHGLREALFEEVGSHLQRQGLRLSRGTIMDAQTGVAHTVVTAPANEHDVTRAFESLHGSESQVWGDSGYQGVQKRSENRDRPVDWQMVMKPGKRWQLPPESEAALAERRKASVRAKAEHVFGYLKRHFGYAKVRYRGLEKNTQRIYLLVGFANLTIAERSGVTA